MIPPDYINRLWLIVKPYLLLSYESSDQDIPLTLRADLVNGTRQLWVISKQDVTIVAAGVTSIHAMRSGLALRIEHLGGGSMRLWLPLLNELEAFARSRHCIKVIWEGRKGWVRLIPDYHVVRVTMVKRLDDGRHV